MIKHIISPKVSIGFAAACIVVMVNAVVAYQSISKIAENNRSINKIHHLGTRRDSILSELDRLQAESKQSLDRTKIVVGIAGLLDLLLLIFLYGLVNRDLKQQHQAKSIQRKFVTEFEELYNSAPCGYHSLDATGKFIRINRTELEMLGYEESEIVGCKRITDLFAPTSIQIFNDNFPVIKARGWIHDLEFEMVCKDGKIIPVSASVMGIYDDQGNYIGSRSTVIDIKERVKSRKQARLSAEISHKIRQSLQLDEILQTAVEEFQKILEVDRVLIFRLEQDGTGKIVQEKVLPGYPVAMGSKIIDPCFDLSYHHKYQQGRIYTISDITQAGLTPCYIEFLQQFGVKSSVIVPIKLRDELWGLLIVHHCQSTRSWYPKEVEIMSQLSTQIEIALAQAQLLEQEQIQRQELTRSNIELAQFAHIASHDLQEPLRMVISYLQLLERRYQGKLDADADEFIGYAVDGAVRMQTLIQALLSYARLSSQKQPFNTVDVELVFQAAISNLQVSISDSGAMISHDPFPTVWGDTTQLIQVFQNLIGNAIKFRRVAPPKIHISVQAVGAAEGSQTHSSSLAAAGLSMNNNNSATPNLIIDLTPSSTKQTAVSPAAWCFAVADNGIGIEEQYLDRIFVIFQRLHTRANYPGTGIGLAICKKIIERHCGTMWVESRPMNSDSLLSQSLPGQPESCGSIFYFTVPAVGSSSPHANKQPHH